MKGNIQHCAWRDRTVLKFIHNQFNFTINRKRLFYDTTLVVLIACTHQEICNKNMHTVLCKSYANTILPLFVSWQLKVNFASGTSVKCQKHFCKILLSYQDKQSEISAKISQKFATTIKKTWAKFICITFAQHCSTRMRSWKLFVKESKIIMLVKATFLVTFCEGCPQVAAQCSQRIACGCMPCNGLSSHLKWYFLAAICLTYGSRNWFPRSINWFYLSKCLRLS